MARIVIDDSRKPLIVIHYPKEFTIEELHASYLEMEQRVMSSHTVWGLVSDTGGSTPSAAMRSVMAEWINKQKVELKKYCVGNGIILSSAVQRGVFMALNWAMKSSMPVETRPFPDMASAEAWVRGRLQQAKERSVAASP